LLRTPVAAAHITSGFGMRMHPLLGYTKMHKGVDFGASIGTPIFAAGNGTIDVIGFENGYGRYIKIRHNGNLATAYAHMSRFAANMYQGAHVNQGQVIGYVGMSGRATGPHLHFEVHVNGQQVNPMSVNLPTGRSLDGKLLADFRAGQAKVRQEFMTMLAKRTPAAPAPLTGKGPLIEASTTTRAFATKPSESCGLRGGC
jgi:murein DD-endopeptidase MepM/ murein hydrolase activator NlpD